MELWVNMRINNISPLYSREYNGYRCKMCRTHQLYTRKFDLERHLSMEHGDEYPFKCDIGGCNKSYQQEKKLIEHINKHAKNTAIVHDITRDSI